MKKKRKYTFEQEMQLREFYGKRHKENLKQISKFLKSIWSWLFSIVPMAFKVLFVGFVSALAGMQSEPIIYALNKSMGLGYAHFASYMESALIGAILFAYFFSNSRRRRF